MISRVWLFMGQVAKSDLAWDTIRESLAYHNLVFLILALDTKEVDAAAGIAFWFVNHGLTSFMYFYKRAVTRPFDLSC
jgi:hypothetical protein